jgi:hypothetical protein
VRRHVFEHGVQLFVARLESETDHARDHVLPALAREAHRCAAFGGVTGAAQLLDLGLALPLGELDLGGGLTRRDGKSEQSDTGRETGTAEEAGSHDQCSRGMPKAYSVLS